MNCQEYKSGHFGKPIDIYTRDGKLILEEVVPVKGGTVTSSPAVEGEVFEFEINPEGTSLAVPVDCEIRLSSQNTVTTEELI